MLPWIASDCDGRLRVRRAGRRAPAARSIRQAATCWLERRGSCRVRAVRARQELLGGALEWHQRGTLGRGRACLGAALYSSSPSSDPPGRCRDQLRGSSGPELGARMAGGTRDGSAAGLVPRLLVGVDGRAVRARRDEPHLDGADRGAGRLEKAGPWGCTATVVTAGVLVVLAVAILAVPQEVPGFVLPGSTGSMHAMKAMGRGPG